MKKTAAGCLLAAASALAACSSGHSSAPAAPPSIEQVAAQIGATGVQHLSSPTLYAYDEANATWHGRAVDIATFKTQQLRDNWIKIAEQFTGIEKTGPLYAVADA